MQLLTYLDSQKQPRVGILIGSSSTGQVIDSLQAVDWLNNSSTFQPSSGPVSSASLRDMIAVIQNQQKVMPAFEQILKAYGEDKLPRSMVQSIDRVKLLSPLPRPTSLRDGYAFRQHVEAARKSRGLPMAPEYDQFPVFYYSNALAVTGPGDIQVQKLARERLDFELEIAIVIGKEGRNIPASEADSYIFGYTIMNDWSARGLQTEEMKLNLGPAKGKDFGTSLGPILVTRDSLKKFLVSHSGNSLKNEGERYNLSMKAYLNGKQLSDGNSKDMSWTFAQIIERASYGTTLYPGEVIGSGTVGTGCLLELNGSKITDNLWLKDGDEVVLEIQELGRLVNRIVAID